MKFTVSKYFETWTEDDVEAGDTDDRGTVYEGETFSLRELVSELRGADQLSDVPQVNSGTWASWYGEMDTTGETRNESLHVNLVNGKRPSARQMEQVYRAAGGATPGTSARNSSLSAGR